MDLIEVQPTEPVSPVEPVSQPAVTPAVVPEPSPEEVLNQKITQAVAEAIAKETEKSKREIQSAKDKATAEVRQAQQRTRLAESTTSAYRTFRQTADPDTAKELELAEYRAKEQARQTQEQEEQMAQYQANVIQQFHENMNQFITGLGVDPKDTRIDWAGDAPDLLTAQRRILDSVTKIQSEKVKASEAEIDKKIKEAEKRIKKDLGIVEDVNSVSTSMSGGASVSGIPTDINKFRTWVENLPMAEYEKLKPEIDKMMAEGRIK